MIIIIIIIIIMMFNLDKYNPEGVKTIFQNEN